VLVSMVKWVMVGQDRVMEVKNQTNLTEGTLLRAN
jgi:hypothetical protein